MNDFLKKNWATIIGIVVFSVSVSFGISSYNDFFKTLCVVLPLSSIVMYFMYMKYTKEDETVQIIQSLDQIIGEQTQVIEEYEKIFDSQLVELPCVCGGNTFEGLFSPKLENIVECEKCKNKYRVDVNYNSILISEPADVNKSFDQLISENIN